MIYTHLRENTPGSRHPTVLGQVTTENYWQNIIIHEGKHDVLAHLQSSVEEADLGIPLHVYDCLKAGYKTCVVVSSDTDVIVRLLNHVPLFQEHNLQELWVRAGVGDTTRYLPLHTLHQCLGNQLCAVLPAIHSLTVCDITSKVDTKKAAVKAVATKYLENFGVTPNLTQQTIKDAENYLVKVLRKVMPTNSMTSEQRFFIVAKTAHTSTFLQLPKAYCLTFSEPYNTYKMTMPLKSNLIEDLPYC